MKLKNNTDGSERLSQVPSSTSRPPMWCDNRYPIPNSTFPIAQAVKVSGDRRDLLYQRFRWPPVVSKDADPTSPQGLWRHPKTQTVGVLNKIKAILEGPRARHGRLWSRCRHSLFHDAAGRRWISSRSWRATRNSSLAAVSPICRQGPLSGVAALANPGFFWSRSK